MAATLQTGPGAVLSADIAVPDHDRELRFYSRVLTTGQAPFWRDDLMNSLGIPIIGLGERVQAYAELPLQWMPHLQVEDVGVSAERAVALGGRVLVHHEDEEGRSQWAVVVDPNGAAFGLIPVVPSEAIPSSMTGPGVEATGRIAWLDLTVPNAPATRDFYRDVVGWSVKDVEMEDAEGSYADYALCTADGTGVAGACHARGVNQGLPPVWLLYLPVGDLDESLARAREEGGEVLRVRTTSSGDPAYAVLRDPVGACFALVPG